MHASCREAARVEPDDPAARNIDEAKGPVVRQSGYRTRTRAAMAAPEQRVREIRFEPPPFHRREEVRKHRHASGAGAVQLFLPACRTRMKAGPVEMPDRIVAEELPRRSREQSLICLHAHALAARAELVLVGAFHEEEGPVAVAAKLL